MPKTKPLLKEYHARAQKWDFKRKVVNIAKIQPSFVDVLYKELALDSSVSSQAMFLGKTCLVADSRSLNPGRTGNSFDVFLSIW